jgi:mannose-1-phosphate guanylyltransferase
MASVDAMGLWHGSCTTPPIKRGFVRHVWIVVLAAGAGRRLAAVTGGVPKQFWRPGTEAPSLLEDTLARMRPIGPRERTMTIVDESHHRFIGGLQPLRHASEVIYQPEDRGTAAGVLMPLVRVDQLDRDAIVVLTPSDHGVEDPLIFQASVSRAIAAVHAGHSGIVLFGVTPTSATEDYGWITPRTRGDHADTFRPVEAFVEKPPVAEAERLLRSGAVWNTMVLVARARALLTAFERALPVHTRTLVSMAAAASDAPSGQLKTAYRNLPAADFSRDVLSRTRPMVLLTLPAATGWSDLGTPDRLRQWLSRRATCAA